MGIAVLRNRNFRRLWTAVTIDSFGSWLLVMAVPLEIFTITGSAMSTGLALAVEAVPAVLIGPWAGVAVDRWHRKKVLLVANLVSAAGVALMLLATTPARLGFMYLGLIVENAAVCFLWPAARAVTPAVVGSHSDLASANSLSAFTNSAFRMIGPPAGTFLVARGWFGAAALVDMASCLVAAAIITGVAVKATDRPDRVTPRIAGELREGLRHIAGTAVLRGLLATSWLYWTANAALTVLLIPFAATRLHSSGQAVGYLIAGLGAGYLCGSAISKALIARFTTRTVLTIAYGSVGLCFLVMFTATALPTALVAVTVSGVPGAVAQVATGHRLQTTTPDAVLGRVSAAFYTSDAVAAVTGALIAPAAVAVTGLGVALIILSATVLVTAAMAVTVLPRGDAEDPDVVPAASARVTAVP
jgi:predicted MFS family arabinose efflux permease